jgi:hypothetical protein
MAKMATAAINTTQPIFTAQGGTSTPIALIAIKPITTIAIIIMSHIKVPAKPAGITASNMVIPSVDSSLYTKRRIHDTQGIW